MWTQNEWAVISNTMHECMPIMHVQTDSKMLMLKKCNIPVNNMNRRYTWYLYRGSKEKVIQTRVI